MTGFYALIKEQESIPFPEKPFDPGGRPAKLTTLGSDPNVVNIAST